MELTPEMKEFFFKRTGAHTSMVRENCKKLVYTGDKRISSKILFNCITHDQSKFEEPQLTPYIWVTWSYKCKADNIPFEVSPEIKELMTKATELHVKTEKHHPEFWTDQTGVINKDNRDTTAILINAEKMLPEYICEMVADWNAVSKERGTNSTKEWCDKNVGTRWKFNEKQKELIYYCIDLLEK